MCTMGNISFYILLICAIQHSFARNGKKKLFLRSNNKFTEIDFEQEAIRDIENVLMNNMENNTVGKNNEVKKSIYEPTSIYEGNEYLKKQVAKLLKRLNIKKRSGADEQYANALRSGNDQDFEDLTPRARYRQFISNLDLNHRDAIKSRLITVVGDSKFDDMFKSDKNNRFEQIMKKLASHRDDSIDTINNIGTDYNLDFMDKTLRQRLDYTDINPGIHTTTKFVTNDKTSDKNKGPEKYVQNQHKLYNKFENDENKESKPVMRADYMPKSNNYVQLHKLPQANFRQRIKKNTSKENLQVNGNNIGMRNEFWKQLSAREKGKVPHPQTSVKIKSEAMINLDAIQRQDSKLTGDSLRFHDIINPENINELPRVLKTPEVKYREEIREQYHSVNNWPELPQKLSTNRIEDISDNIHHIIWQNDGQRSDIHKDDLNDLLYPHDNNHLKKLEQESTSERKDDINEILNPGNDDEWQTLLKRFSISRIGEISDVLHPLDQPKIDRKLDINYTEDKSNILHSENNDDWKFLENQDEYLRPDSGGKKLPDERSLHKAESYYNLPLPDGLKQEISMNSGGDSPDHHGKRTKRSAFTQAGYTHDPDTCKMYNENLVKLWSNLSKYINASEQPNERALHNIAVMIEAYLEHQNLKQSTDTFKVKHEGRRDKISEVTLKIKKMLDEGEGSSEKITKMITKYIKPFYGDVENKECQQVNEESLGSSVVLLYNNYLEDIDCNNESEITLRSKKLSLRKLATKSIKSVSSDWHSTDTEFKPEIKSILSEDELYSDFHRGKMPRQRHPTKNKRVLKRGRKRHSPSATRSGDQNINDSEKLKTRSKVSRKASNKKLKKSSRKSDLEKNRCEKYAIRKLTVSLRPVIERFMALLECQLDNTLRSINYQRVSMNPYYLYASKLYSDEDSRREKKTLPLMRLTQIQKERAGNNSQKKLRGGYDVSNETKKDTFLRDSKNSIPWVRKYSLDRTTGMNSPISSISSDILDLNSNYNNNEYTTSYSEYLQSPPLYDDYDGISKPHSSSFINPLISVNKNKKNEKRTLNSGILKTSSYYEDYPEEPKYIMTVSDQQSDSNVTDVSYFNDLTKLRHEGHIAGMNFDQKEKTVKKLESIAEFLRKARDESLQTPEFAVPFALNSNKGYVELTHLVKYPKMLVYRPQFIVKNTMPYDDFLKTINNFNMTNDHVRLMKIVRHLPDSSVKVLFETEDFESPLEVRNVKESYRRSGSQNYLVESRTDTMNKNNDYDENTDFTDEASGESLITVYRDEVHSNFMDILFKPDGSRSGEDNLNSASNLNLDLNSKNKSNMSNSASNPTSDSGSSLGLLPSVASNLISNIPGLGSSTGVGKALGSAVGSHLDSGVGTGLDTALNLGSTFQLNPIHSSELSAYLSKLLPPHSSSQSDSELHLSLNSHSQSNTAKSASNSHLPVNSLSSSTKPRSRSSSLEPSTANRYADSDSIPPSSTQPPVNQWWKRWKDLFKQKIKKIVGGMATLADNIDHIIKF